MSRARHTTMTQLSGKKKFLSEKKCKIVFLSHTSEKKDNVDNSDNSFPIDVVLQEVKRLSFTQNFIIKNPAPTGMKWIVKIGGPGCNRPMYILSNNSSSKNLKNFGICD